VAQQSKGLEAAMRVALGISKQRTLDLGGGVKMVFVRIPAGRFMMGDPPEAQGKDYDRAKPRHEVTLTRAFYLGKSEVTQAQYERLMGNNPSKWKGADLPVEQVSWPECRAFCEKLGEVTGRKTRLPTEAEWELACRAGTTTRFSFGDSDAGLPGMGWFRGNSGGKTHPVGRKKPNKLGLYDMHGNVWEWCLDKWGGFSADAVTDPKGPSKGRKRVVRGGSWHSVPVRCRSASREYVQPPRYHSVGFRVAMDP
jgi:formylglycine-generating enzyme required for sulfatase activity